MAEEGGGGDLRCYPFKNGGGGGRTHFIRADGCSVWGGRARQVLG